MKYLEAYDEGRNLEHMDRDTHKIILRETLDMLNDNSKFRSLAMEYVDRDDHLYELIGGAK